MLAFIIAPFAIALLIFIFIRTVKHFRQYYNKLIAVFLSAFGVFLFCGIIFIIVGFLLPVGPVKRLFTRIGFYWLGFIMYFAVGLAIALLIRHVLWLFLRNGNYDVDKARQITTIFVILFTTIMSGYGIYNAHNLKIVDYEVDVDKKCELNNLNVVLVADLHLGYNVGLKEVHDMVDKINALNPDVIVVAGDIFDNEYEAIEEPEKMAEILKGLNAKYGKYLTYGNHDIQEKILLGFTFTWSKEKKAAVQADERMNQFVKDSGFTFLYDNYEMIADSIYIYGRPDAHKINFGNTTRVDASDVTKGLNKDLPIIVIDHEPSELDELAKAGVDVDLSGHTHKGQVWPGTISINWLWKNPYGLIKIDDMTSIVTSGVGLFGPNMRVDSHAEICNIKINFKK